MTKLYEIILLWKTKGYKDISIIHLGRGDLEQD